MNSLIEAAAIALHRFWASDSAAFLVLALAAACFANAGRLMNGGQPSRR